MMSQHKSWNETRYFIMQLGNKFLWQKFITDYMPQAVIILHNSCLTQQKHNDVMLKHRMQLHK